MNIPIISIVVPVYNVEKYVGHCIQSILNQTYNKFELILVDDGSTDDSGKLCDEWAEKDNRIVVIHKENGGLSDARNAGIEIAKGEYLAFVDSDDYISPSMYQRLFSSVNNYDADIAMCLAYNIYDDDSTYYDIEFGNLTIFQKNEILKSLFNHKLNNFAWNKLYKRELFNDIRYPKGKIYEDLFTTYRLLDKCNKVVLDSSQLYYYRIRKDSIMGKARKVINPDKFQAFDEITDFLQGRDEVLSAAKKYMADDLVADVFKVIAAGTIKENAAFFGGIKQFLQNDIPFNKEKIVLYLSVCALWVLTFRYRIKKRLGS